MRRFILASAVALATVSAAPLASAETVLRMVMHSDVKELDPIWSGAYITRNFGYMIYDTLFAIDDDFRVKPQMVDKWEQSADGLTWTFTLRDGLEWHDGKPVTRRIASSRSSAGRRAIRWARNSRPPCRSTRSSTSGRSRSCSSRNSARFWRRWASRRWSCPS
jgi:peptide/nickel transport system substrate-binding protein